MLCFFFTHCIQVSSIWIASARKQLFVIVSLVPHVSMHHDLPLSECPSIVALCSFTSKWFEFRSNGLSSAPRRVPLCSPGHTSINSSCSCWYQIKGSATTPAPSIRLSTHTLTWCSLSCHLHVWLKCLISRRCQWMAWIAMAVVLLSRVWGPPRMGTSFIFTPIGTHRLAGAIRHHHLTHSRTHTRTHTCKHSGDWNSMNMHY